MTPKEKADELLTKFGLKEIAIDVCNEVITALDYVDSMDNHTHSNWWEDVKLELNK